MKPALSVFVVCVTASAASLPSTSEILLRAGKSVERFWDHLASIDCVETVEQEKLGVRGKIMYRQESAYDYLAVLQLAGNDVLVDESRSAIREPEHGKNLPLLITNGFSTFAFIFHPLYQGAFEYATPEPVQVEGAQLLEVKFRHVRGTRSPTVLKLGQREYPVEWQGTAWIDPESGGVVRVSAALMESMNDIGLKSLRADVRYARVDFKEQPGPLWLPASATIEVETARQHWRNVHSFAKYRLFSVDVKTKMEEPK